MKKIISLLLVLAAVASLGMAFALTPGDARAVIGANLTDDQTALVYQAFGIARGDVIELTVTNAEEREYLSDFFSDADIGTRSISCVYIEILQPGAGLEVSTSNINKCTEEMYRNALITAGVYDAKVIVAAPFSVSGTAALTGIYKAYENLSGEQLSYEAKIAGTQELAITAELADEIGNYDAVTIVNELKLILNETVNMSDDEICAEIRRIAQEYNVSITDAQVEQLLSLCRSLEGLSTDELQAKVESVQDTLKKLAGVQETASGIVNSLKGFFDSIGSFFSNLFGKKS